MRGKRNQHEWCHMGIDDDSGVSYGYCPLCKKFQEDCGGPGFTFIKKKFLNERIAAGKVRLDGKIIKDNY